MTEGARPAHIQRCTYTEIRGGLWWQCLQPDPHPSGEGHKWSIDAEFGRVLHEQSPDWLAATLRDREALRQNVQHRADALQAIAMDLATHWSIGYGELQQETADWVRKNNPTAAARLGIS